MATGSDQARYRLTPLRILIASVGSRGDVQPFIYLSQELAKRAHHVVLSLDRGHLEAVRPSPRVSLLQLGSLGRSEISAVIARATTAPSAPERTFAAYNGLVGYRDRAVVRRLAELVTGQAFDLVAISSSLLVTRGNKIAWSTPTAIIAYTIVTGSSSGFFESLPCLRLVALSPVVVPEKERYDNVWQYTGFWSPSKSRLRGEKVETFLESGTAPFLLTMGSMSGFDPTALSTAFVQAARRCGRRAIIQRGWATLAFPKASDVLVAGELDYAAVFPRCEGLFLHGGTGTVAAALKSGCPTALLPLMPDQLLWAQRLKRMGICFGTIDPFSPDPRKFEQLMRRTMSNAQYREKAGQVAASISTDNGLDKACIALEQFATAARR